MNQTHTTLRAKAAEALQDRLAARVAAALDECAAELPRDIGERLRVARERAVAHGRRARAVAAAPAVLAAAHGTASIGAPPRWRRLAGTLPLVLLIGGLLLIRQWQMDEQALAVAEVDAQLLSDAVPPSAYADPGFVEFLRQPQP